MIFSLPLPEGHSPFSCDILFVYVSSKHRFSHLRTIGKLHDCTVLSCCYDTVIYPYPYATCLLVSRRMSSCGFWLGRMFFCYPLQKQLLFHKNETNRVHSDDI